MRDFIKDFYLFFTWRDGLEILLLAYVIYGLSMWLKKDKHKNLLGYFYTYCLSFFLAHALQLTTISHLLICASPIVALLFIIFHQYTLQKNFVALRTLTHPEPEQNNWLETVIQSCLIAINNNQEIIAVIECTDSLQDYLVTPLALQATITKDLLTILLHSPSLEHDHMLWFNSQGKILGINARWHLQIEQSWKQDALFYTEKMDMLVFKITPAKRQFDIIASGKAHEQLTTPQAITFITNYLTHISSIAKKRETTNAHSFHLSKKQPHAQRDH